MFQGPVRHGCARPRFGVASRGLRAIGQQAQAVADHIVQNLRHYSLDLES